MKAICAWCESEGRPSDLGEREPFYNPATTHCICADHQKRLLELLPSKSFPDAEVLIVVRPNDTALHDHLQRAFAGMRGVKVIMERRAGDRRAAQCPVADERRHRRARRIRQGEVSSLGYTVVRFTPKATVFLKAYSTKAEGAEDSPAYIGLSGIGEARTICGERIKPDQMEFEIQFVHDRANAGLDQYHVGSSRIGDAFEERRADQGRPRGESVARSTSLR